MKILTIDFETYYDRDLGFKTQTTEEYIRDPRFEVIGVAVQEDDGEPCWFSGSHTEIKKFLDQYDWENSFALAHNAIFDGAILNWIFDLRPKAWLDTLSMARPIHGIDAGGSLKALAERYEVGVKGTEVVDAFGKARFMFTAADLAQYGEYCKNDVALTYKLFNILNEGFPVKELKLIDLTIRMFTEPTIKIEVEKLEKYLEELKDRKAQLLESAETNKEVIMSNDKFAQALMALGVMPPTKISVRTKKEAWAFSKTDSAFRALLEHENEEVQNLVAARLGVKTTIEETRTKRFIGIGKRGALPVPLKYYAAHTGRWGGADKVNLQNLPSRGNTVIKDSLIAPDGYTFIDCDSSQIEARTLAWLAQEENLVSAFANGEDVYKIMAAKIYDKDVDEISKEERFFGKTVILGCFGPDTKVLTDNGWKRIVDVQATDMLWDGEEWVNHQGVVPQGEKEVLTAHGVSATLDHEILTERGWQEWQEVITNPSLFQSALNKANLPSLIGNNTQNRPGVQRGGIRLSNAVAGGKAKLIGITSKQNEQRDVIPVQKFLAQKLENIIGGMKQFFLMNSTEQDYLIGLRLAYQGVIHQPQKCMNTMVNAESLFTNRGEQNAQRFLNTYLHLMAGKIPVGRLTGLTSIKDTNQIISDLQPDQKTCSTEEKQKICKQRLMTYDVAYAGPRNRYTIATSAGPIIVHNCGYGMGHKKFHLMLKLQGVDISEDEAERIIKIYRNTYPRIKELWYQGNDALQAMLTEAYADFGKRDVVKVIKGGFELPNKLKLIYNNLKCTQEGVPNGGSKDVFTYDSRKEKGIYLYGGKVVENVVQALARIIVGEQMIRISKKYRVVLTVHDAIMITVKDQEVEQARAYVEECMRWVPDWATGLPVNCESGVGKSYGKC
jgi:DNA polymerase I-like protein with 3'-5' exonuclease and polymerase domains